MERESLRPGLCRWWGLCSLQGKVFAALMLTGLVPVLLLGSYSFVSERRRAVALELSRLSEQSQRLAVFVDRFLASNSLLAQHLALTSEVASFLAEEPMESRQRSMNAWLQAHRALGQDQDDILLLRPDGLCTASSEPRYIGTNYAFRAYFQDAMAGRSRFTDFQIGLRRPDPFVGIARAVTRKGKVLGVLLLRISVHRIQEEVAARSVDGKIAYLINPDGIFLAHSRPELVYSAIAPIPPQRLQEIKASRQFMGREHPVVLRLNPESIQSVFRVLATGRPEEVRYTANGSARWVALQRLEGLPWVIGVAANESQILSHSKRILLLTLLVCFLSLALVGLGGYGFSRKVLRPLKRLKGVMDGFAKGDAGERAPGGGEDEIGSLGRQFNDMADTIQAQTEALARRVDTLEGILPVCASCRKIRNEEGVYQPLETYVAAHTQAQFSHGLCEACARKLYPEFYGPEQGLKPGGP